MTSLLNIFTKPILASALLFSFLGTGTAWSQEAPQLMAQQQEKPKIGLFIASVDPITKAHLEVIKIGIRQLQLQKVIVMVNSGSDKDYSASVNERIQLVKIALSSFSKDDPSLQFEVISDPPEGKRDFAIKVAHQQAAGGIIYQIAGQDVQPKAKELFSGLTEVQSYILPRLERGQNTVDPTLLAGFHLLKPETVSSISSTEVKENLESGRTVADMISPPEVLREIVKNGLYFPLSDAEAQRKGEFLLQKMNYLIKAMAATPQWQSLTIPNLAGKTQFDLQTGVSTKNSISFNRIQSLRASDALIIRVIAKLNSNLSASAQLQFRDWAAVQLASPAMQELENQFRQTAERVATRAAIIVVRSIDTVDSVTEQIQKLGLKGPQAGRSSQVLVYFVQETNPLARIRSALTSFFGDSEDARVKKITNSIRAQIDGSYLLTTLSASQPEFLIKTDEFLRQNRALPLQALNDDTTPELNLRSLGYRQNLSESAPESESASVAPGSVCEDAFATAP